MELFRNYRLKIGNSILVKKSLKTRRIISYTDIDNIKKIGIVWDATKTGDFTSLSKFHQKMQEKNVDVKVIGYYPGKELPDQYTAIRFLTCIRRNELSFIYLPVSTEADVFINSKFDVLIDINFDKVFPLQYISTLSSASFKVGLFNSEADSSTFDLMMEIKKPVQVENYLTQVIHYLEMINSGTTLKAVNQ
jgi:hypothetical protein